MKSDSGVATITAIVHTADGVRFLATDVSREVVAARIACYVRERCDDVLLADAASQVHTMLRLGNLDAAITAYFERVGERWEEERLELFSAEGKRAEWTSEKPMLIDARH